MNFTDALDQFCKAVNDDTEYSVGIHYTSLTYSSNSADLEADFRPLDIRKGRRYVRLVRLNRGRTTGHVYCFIDSKNGDILMAATWKSPAKGSRGNIYFPKTYTIPKGNLHHTTWLYKL